MWVILIYDTIAIADFHKVAFSQLPLTGYEEIRESSSLVN